MKRCTFKAFQPHSISEILLPKPGSEIKTVTFKKKPPKQQQQKKKAN